VRKGKESEASSLDGIRGARNATTTCETGQSGTSSEKKREDRGTTSTKRKEGVGGLTHHRLRRRFYVRHRVRQNIHARRTTLLGRSSISSATVARGRDGKRSQLTGMGLHGGAEGHRGLGVRRRQHVAKAVKKGSVWPAKSRANAGNTVPERDPDGANFDEKTAQNRTGLNLFPACVIHGSVTTLDGAAEGPPARTGSERAMAIGFPEPRGCTLGTAVRSGAHEARPVTETAGAAAARRVLRTQARLGSGVAAPPGANPPAGPPKPAPKS